MSPKIRVATWNVNYRRLRQSHICFLQGLDIDILMLQEVSPVFYQDVHEASIYPSSVYSLNLQPHEWQVAKNIITKPVRSRGCAIFVRSPGTIQHSFLLQELPFSERSVVADIAWEGSFVRICSFHTPPGASWHELKAASYIVLSDWLKSQTGPTILGIDANAPKVDHPDIMQNEWTWKQEPYVLGHDRIHHLDDAYRTFLDAHQTRMEAIIKERPTGPLAVSFIRGNRFKRTPSRFDFIYITPGIQVAYMDYLYNEATQAGSDHALAVADLIVPF